MFSISRICVFMLSGVAVVGGVIELAGVLSVEIRWVRFVCTKDSVCSLAPMTSSFNWANIGCGIGNLKQIECA